MRSDPRDHPLHPELRGPYRSVIALALILLPLGVYVIARPLAHWPLKPYELVRSGIDLIVGLILTTVGVISLRVARFYRRCGWLLELGPRRRMQVHLVRVPQGGLFVELRRPDQPPTSEPDVRTQVTPPRWNVDAIEGRVVDARIDEDPMGPVVIETEQGPLWPDPLSARKVRWWGPKA